MRLTIPIHEKFDDADAWAAAHRRVGYGAAYCYLNPDIADSVANDYVAAARRHDVVIAEVGAWSNPLDTDPVKAAEALEKCRLQLDLAERVGALCCVNIAGSCSPSKWDGPHADNFLPATFDRIVETVRSVIDAVKPRRTFYTLETMPWIFPSSPDEYLTLIRAIDRPAFGVHLDPVNMINCPERAQQSGAFLRECFAKLGPYIKSCHAKDIVLRDGFMVHLDECRPGTGVLDYATFLREANKLDPDLPICLEHLSDNEYPIAAEHLRSVAAANGLTFR